MVKLQSPGPPLKTVRTTGQVRRPTQLRDDLPLSQESPPLVWAIDAFPDHPELQARTATMIQRLFPNSPVYPVYVMSEESFTDSGFTSSLRSSLKPMAKKTMSALLADIQSLDLKKPRVLIEASASRTACAKRLARFAERIGAGAIALSSHGRRGISKFIIGSFSEAVLNHSHLPTLINGPHVLHLDRRPSMVIFPTDFSEACAAALPKVICLCQRLGAELHLFHKVIHPIDPLVQSGVGMLGGGWVSVDAYFNQPFTDHHSDAEAWIKQARTKGVVARFVPENFREPTSEAVVDYASKMHQASALVVMVSQTGPLTSALFGSVTRDVIRLSPAPVYLIPRIETAESQP